MSNLLNINEDLISKNNGDKKCENTNKTNKVLTSEETFIYEECPICFEYLDTKEEVCTLSCKHKYHLNCLIDWYRKPNSNYNCPLCVVHREIINIENTKPICSDINIPVIYKKKK